MNLTLIWAQGRNRAIGVKDTLPWRLPEDMARFKALTVGHTVIMGRNTFESLPNGPLPQRLNVVLTSRKESLPPGVVAVGDPQEALAVARKVSSKAIVIGGEQVYRLFLPLADTLLVTCIDVDVPDADAFAPKIPSQGWVPTEESERLTSKSGLEFQFVRYSRIAKTS